MAVFDTHSNLAVSTVLVAPVPPTSGTSVTIGVGHGSRFKDPVPYNVTIQQPGVVPDPLVAEVCRVTARAGDVFTLLRAQETTTARAIQVGDLIYVSITAKSLTDIEAAIGTSAPALHHLTHEDGGSDEVTLASSQVTGLDTALAGKVETTDPRLTDARVPLPHAPSHSVGGSDAVTVTALAGYPGGTTTFLRADATFSAASGGVPSLHAPTHASGGTDPVTVTGLAGYPGGATTFLRADGTFATPATGVPAAHHVTHEPGGPDALVTAAWTPLANIFTADQTLRKAAPALAWDDLSGPVDSRSTRITNVAQSLYVQRYSDAGVFQATILTLDASGILLLPGGVLERNRTVAMGAWIAVPYSAANFTTNSAAVWTVDPGDVSTYAYSLVGTTLILLFEIDTTSVSAPTQELRVAIPGGFTAARTSRNAFQLANNSVVGSAMAYVGQGNAFVSCFADLIGSPWAVAVNTTNVNGMVIISVN